LATTSDRKLPVNKQCQEALQQYSHLPLIKKQEALDIQLDATTWAMVIMVTAAEHCRCHDEENPRVFQ